MQRTELVHPGSANTEATTSNLECERPAFQGRGSSVSDGYQQSSEITAIVIDNGQIVLVTFWHICNIANLYGLIQAPVSLEQAGRLIKLRVSPSFQT
jgi:hypothetical protein